ncbi:SKU5 similar 13 [Zea mays]|uniref:SKU5 similar 13 n=1 Tax=Zea mays TaxID=4577 RepID=A0A1D6M6W3_MAIZE|nr:SKU5 similar 13 [Zea mays]
MATTTRVAAAATGVLLVLSALATLARAEDPYLFFEWKVTYGTKSLLGVPQKVILINGEFPGPRINCSSNNNIVVNVFNQLDHPLLFTQERDAAQEELVDGRDARHAVSDPAAAAVLRPRALRRRRPRFLLVV